MSGTGFYKSILTISVRAKYSVNKLSKIDELFNYINLRWVVTRNSEWQQHRADWHGLYGCVDSNVVHVVRSSSCQSYQLSSCCIHCWQLGIQLLSRHITYTLDPLQWRLRHNNTIILNVSLDNMHPCSRYMPKAKYHAVKQYATSWWQFSWDTCKSVPRPRQITMPPLHHLVFYRSDVLPATQPTVSKQWRQTINTV